MDLFVLTSSESSPLLRDFGWNGLSGPNLLATARAWGTSSLGFLRNQTQSATKLPPPAAAFMPCDGRTLLAADWDTRCRALPVPAGGNPPALWARELWACDSTVMTAWGNRRGRQVWSILVLTGDISDFFVSYIIIFFFDFAFLQWQKLSQIHVTTFHIKWTWGIHAHQKNQKLVALRSCHQASSRLIACAGRPNGLGRLAATTIRLCLSQTKIKGFPAYEEHPWEMGLHSCHFCAVGALGYSCSFTKLPRLIYKVDSSRPTVQVLRVPTANSTGACSGVVWGHGCGEWAVPAQRSAGYEYRTLTARRIYSIPMPPATAQ